jgi:hypothetical protein
MTRKPRNLAQAEREWEDSPADRKKDRKMGWKEGSPADEKADKAEARKLVKAKTEGDCRRILGTRGRD